MSVIAYVGLGSNLAEPPRQFRRALLALSELPDTELVACAPWYWSRAVGPGEQPDYLNSVARLVTTLSAQRLLREMQAIEQAQQRRREQHWGPRTLDLDLLLYGDQVIASAELTVPHPHLGERDFVLQPLLDLAPDAVLPNGETVAALLAGCASTELRPWEPAGV